MKRLSKRILASILMLALVFALPFTAQAGGCSNNGEHKWSQWYTEFSANCEWPGEQYRYCEICHTTERREYPAALGHNFQFVVREQPTCTKAGYGIDTCTRCGANRDNGRPIPALGHNYERSVAQQPTCTSDGMAIYRCTRCGDSYREPIPATGHKWGAWQQGEAATCVKYGNRYHDCSRCGAREWERDYASGLGDHDWGEWVTVKEPTATEDGLKERVCKVDASHKEQEVIPATGEPAEEAKPALKLDMGLWVPAQYVVEDGHSVPNPDKEAIDFEDQIRLDYYEVTNTGNVPLLFMTVITTGNNVEILNDIKEFKKVVSGSLNPSESKDASYISFSHWASEENMIPDPEDSPYAGTYKETWIVYGYALDDTEYTTPICKSNAYTFECKIAKSKELHPELTLTDIGDSFNLGESEVELYFDPQPEILSPKYRAYASGFVKNTGDVELKIVEYVEYGTGETKSQVMDSLFKTLSPSKRYSHGWGGYLSDHITPGTETAELLGTVTVTWWAVGYDPETGEELCKSNEITRTWKVGKYTDGMTSEEEKPALLLTVVQTSPEKEAYIDTSYFTPYNYIINTVTVTNIGNMPLRFDIYAYEGADAKPYRTGCDPYTILNPGESWSITNFDYCITNRYGYNPPDSADSPYLGSYPYSNKAFGYAVDDTNRVTPICESNIVEFSHRIAKPGPEPWPIPEESDLSVALINGIPSSDPAGYQVGEKWCIFPRVTNAGLISVDGFTVHEDIVASEIDFGVSSATDNKTWKEEEDKYPLDPAHTMGVQGIWGIVTADDIDRGYIMVSANVKWTDPDSGNERTAYASPVILPMISKTGLLLSKDVANEPAEGYFNEGDQIEWSLSMKNNSKEPIKDITVTDKGATIGMFAEFTPEQGEIKLGVPKYTVTEYDAKVTGKVINYAVAKGTDLKGVEHTYTSNTATAKTKADTPEPFEPGGGGDPLGPVYDVHPAVSIIKAEAHKAASGDWYALDEMIDYTITVKNTGDTPLTNVQVYDSLGGFVPIGSCASLAVNEEKTFTFSWKTTAYDVDVTGYVVNQATVTYDFLGSIHGTPMTSNKVYVKAGEDGSIIIDGGDGHFDPEILHTAGDSCCALTLNYAGDGTAYYTVTLCAEHQKVLDEAKAAADTGDWAKAVELIRTALDEFYGIYYEAADEEAKAAVINERLAFYAHIGAYQTLAGDRAAAEKLMLKLIQMCCMANTAQETLPDSMINAKNSLLISDMETKAGRYIGLFDGKDEVTEGYEGPDARALNDVIGLLREAKSYDFNDVFERGQILWQASLDESVNAIYKAADREQRKLIAAWRISLDTLYHGERPFLELLYPGNDAVTEEVLMNLYKDTAMDKEQIK